VDHDLTRRVERAALGAMITDQQMAARLHYLDPADFTDPRHQWVFRTVRSLSAEPHRAPGNWLDLIARTAGRSVNRKYLDELAAACPDPDHGPAYGAMLVQATVYRQARHHADQMDVQAAMLGAEGSRLSEAGAHGADQTAQLSALLAEVAKAVREHTAMLAPQTPDPAAGSVAGPRPATASAESSGPAPTAVAERHEELVLSAVLQEHPQAGQILEYLPAAAFTSPDRQEIFRAARRLHQSGRPVDELTVGWDLATRAAVTAVVSPGNPPEPQVPDAYISSLANANISTGQSPLRTAHELDTRLKYRTSSSPRLAAGTASTRQPDRPDWAPRPGAAQAQDAPGPAAVVPLIRPQTAVELRPADPEHKR
jgi:DnaB-like helicase N terminal domain